MCTSPLQIKRFAVVAAFVSLTACSSPRHRRDEAYDPAGRQPEPVLIIYHVKLGAVTELEGLVKRAWEIYENEHMVLSHPHVCVRVKEDDHNIRLVEVFSWVSHFATEHPPAPVREIWNQMQFLCEERRGNLAMEVRTAEMLIPRTAMKP